MKSVIVRRETCRLCGGKKHDLILSLAPTPIADAYVQTSQASRKQDVYPLDLFLCAGCGHAQLLDVIDADVLYRDYIYVTTSSLGLGEHFKGYANHVVEKLELSQGARAVDIGSNDGTLLRNFKRLGMNVLGVEPAREIAAQATESGVKTVPEFFTAPLAGQLRKDYGAASVITMNNLFANIDDLQGTAEGIRSLLAPDGVFVFETFYFVDYIENMVFDFMYHEHLCYNTIKPLSAYFKAHGMEIFDVERVPTKGGSIRCYVQLAGGPRSKAPVVAQHIAYEEKLGIHHADSPLFQDFSGRIEAQKQHLRGKIAELKKQGGSIGAYGASATSTTMLYHFGLTDDIDFIVDDNESRQNTLSPGAHIPVVPSSEILRRNPAAIVILAWRYHEPIIRNNESYLKQGGKFLIPLPEFRVV